MTSSTAYENERRRQPVQPPLVPLSAVRSALGLTQEALCESVAAITNKTFTKGALSAIERGHRGASAETLAALEVALRMPSGSLVVDYEPTHARRKNDVAA